MTKDNVKVLSLSDSVIAHVARLLQVSMLTGTDIVDHMRMVRLTEDASQYTDDNHTLILDEEYSSIFDGTLDKMMENVSQQNNQG